MSSNAQPQSTGPAAQSQGGQAAFDPHVEMEFAYTSPEEAAAASLLGSFNLSKERCDDYQQLVKLPDNGRPSHPTLVRKRTMEVLYVEGDKEFSKGNTKIKREGAFRGEYPHKAPQQRPSRRDAKKPAGPRTMTEDDDFVLVEVADGLNLGEIPHPSSQPIPSSGIAGE